MFKVSKKETLRNLRESLDAFDISYTVSGHSVTFQSYPNVIAHVVGIDVVRVDETDADNDIINQTLMSVEALALAL